MLENRISVVELESLRWPASLKIPSKQFRLFVAADVSYAEVESLAEFGQMALESGMVYFWSWGPGCEKFHDVVDEVIVVDYLGKRMFVGPRPEDAVMTTWHDDEKLEEALEFFINSACPTDGFLAESEYWVAICLNNPGWAAMIREQMESID